MSLRRTLVNAALFQLLWFACVGGAAAGIGWLGPVVLVAFALWQIPRSPAPRRELSLMLVTAATGALVDSAMVSAGLVAYASPGPLPGLAPPWIVALWAGFALTLNHSMRWLWGRPLLAAALGASAGPLSFWSGAELWHAVEFAASPALVLGLLGVVWAVLTPVLSSVGRQLESSHARHALTALAGD